ncbi:PREDICTED: mitochondrial uncoupling protein 2-like [Priapulus caudatus]|uniref:Mitochondrial uncoupling protein 2-like n=1 Tax=Priapulus caudatus TaxID=37621 RepID=A0ABM1E6B8_PRICU|nr:PREDICTED: mitochondrial uncoupling protein 2-like [Priapulus caudatus]XP_014667739.1 PREDICTED: mitochondrial uncoupling protein 2-like [Priapulus caudatus]
MSPPSTGPQPPAGVRLIAAGLAGCMAELCTMPLDTAKVRLQIQGEGGHGGPKPMYRGMFGTISTIVKMEGPKALYNGLAAGLQRQMAFASVRVGLYDTVKNFYNGILGGPNKDKVGIHLRIAAGITTGGTAVLCAQPTDVVKVRMQAQARGGSARYKGATHAYKTIFAHEGMRGLWKGLLPNVTRNATVNTTEVVCYDMIKEYILAYKLMKDGIPCHFVSAFCAGFITTVVVSPIDVVKTRFMNSAPGVYRGATQCAMQMMREGGPRAFYKGFVPAFMRLGSWNIAMFICFEQLKNLFMKARATRIELLIPSEIGIVPQRDQAAMLDYSSTGSMSSSGFGELPALSLWVGHDDIATELEPMHSH